MKITKKRLRNIIFEEMKKIDEIKDESKEDPEAIEQAELEQGLDMPAASIEAKWEERQAKKAKNENYRKGYRKMKISKQQLRRIIREEKQKILREQPGMPPMGGPPPAPLLQELIDDISNVISGYVGEVELDIQDEPLSRADIIDFLARWLHEER